MNFTEASDFKDLVTFIPNKREPIHNWYYFKEGYSKQLVDFFIDKFGLGPGSVVLDPFSGCYDSETEVLTKIGWKYFKDLNESDEIATLNPKTENLEYQKPLRFFHYNHKGPMYNVTSAQVNLLVTPNHNMFVAPRKSTKRKFTWKFELMPAERVLGRSVIYKKDAIWNAKRKEYFELDGKKLPMDDWLFFFGLWIAEGSATKYKRKRENGYFYVIQIRNYDQQILEKAAEHARRLGFNPIVTYKQKLRIHNKKLYEYLKQFGKSYEKFIFPELKELNKDQLKIMFDAYILGDGNRSLTKNQINPTISCWTSSPKLRDDMQEIALKIGFSANYSLASDIGDTSTMKDGRIIVARHKNWELTFIQKQNKPRVYGKRSEYDNTRIPERMVDYEGDVWCVEVPNHVLYVRREGKPVWCGNSGTTVLACKQRGIMSVGFDVSPFFAFVANVKTRDYELEKIKDAIAEMGTWKFERPTKLPKEKYITKVFSRYTLEDFVFFRNKVMDIQDAKVRNFFMLALVDSAIKASWTMKDGAVVKIDKTGKPPLKKYFKYKVKRMYKDLRDASMKPIETNVDIGDARQLNLEDNCIDAIITSPPYLNKIEYTKIYGIEMSFLGFPDSTMRSYVGSRADDISVSDIGLDENLPVAAKVYFKDMHAVLSEMYRVCKSGAKAAIVVGGGCFPDRAIEADRITAELAERVGFTVNDVWVARNSWCTRCATIKVGQVRESIILLEK
ncbi:MAG: LAGLIDADG family homing endonuclease [Candidatus Aenigmatarchaeota archaeon]